MLRIAGVQRRVLDATHPAHSFDITALDPKAVLAFSIGLEEAAPPGTVRFEIDFEPTGGGRAQVYARDLNTPGWVDERLDLTAYAGQDGRLTLRKRLVDGLPLCLVRSAWGDPVILPSSAPPRRSVLLVSIDTLRADRVGLYGYPHARTPTLDRLGAQGVWYRHAYSPSTWTLPSHAGLFYGRHLDSPLHQPQPARGPSPPPFQTQALTQIMRQAGYLTAAFTGGGYLSDSFGFSRGFDTYYMFPQPKLASGSCPADRFDGPEVFARAAAWLRERGHLPFFLFVHTYDVHDRCPFRPPGADAFAPWPELNPQDQARLQAFYDDLIVATDARLGELLAELDRLGLTETTLVVVTGDHGELMSEHGLRSHGCTLKPYEELVKVPLIVRYPAVITTHQSIATAVSLIDVAPSVLALLDLPVPSTMTGELLPGLGLGDPPATRSIYVACDDLLAVRQGGLKMIASKARRFRPEIYDITTDPTEQRNVVSSDSANDLQSAADAYWHAQKRVEAAEMGALPDVDPQTRERLRALGYAE